MTKYDDDAPKRRPPRSGRFKPGQSGNPRGRPKGTKCVRTALMHQLATKVTISEQGRTRTVTKAETIAMQMVNKALSGDLKACAAILALTRDQQELSTNLDVSVLARAEDSMVMAGIVSRIRDTHSTCQASEGVEAQSSNDQSSTCIPMIDPISPLSGDA